MQKGKKNYLFNLIHFKIYIHINSKWKTNNVTYWTPDQTNTQGFKITKENVLPLWTFEKLKNDKIIRITIKIIVKKILRENIFQFTNSF